MKIKKGDNVIVISGKDRGKTGKVEKAFTKESSVLISGVNIQKRHEKARKGGKKGQIIEKAFPIHVSNVMVMDPKENKPTRVGYKMVGDKKVRIAKRSGAEL